MVFGTWSEAVTAARDRAGWRRQGNGPTLPEETQEISQVSQVLREGSLSQFHNWPLKLILLWLYGQRLKGSWEIKTYDGVRKAI